MKEAGRYLTDMARRNARAYAALPEARAVLVAGSVAAGQSDFYSDIDLMVYYDALPSEEALAAAREQR
jgi:predicted nucleotidyltransferase